MATTTTNHIQTRIAPHLERHYQANHDASGKPLQHLLWTSMTIEQKRSQAEEYVRTIIRSSPQSLSPELDGHIRTFQEQINDLKTKLPRLSLHISNCISSQHRSGSQRIRNIYLQECTQLYNNDKEAIQQLINNFNPTSQFEIITKTAEKLFGGNDLIETQAAEFIKIMDHASSEIETLAIGRYDEQPAISYTTTPIIEWEGKTYNFGQCTVVIPFRGQISAAFKEPRTPNGNSTTHPHVRHSVICLGTDENVQFINSCLNTMEIVAVAKFIESLLSTFNPGSPYAPITDWLHNFETCPWCGNHRSDESMTEIRPEIWPLIKQLSSTMLGRSLADTEPFKKICMACTTLTSIAKMPDEIKERSQMIRIPKLITRAVSSTHIRQLRHNIKRCGRCHTHAQSIAFYGSDGEPRKTCDSCRVNKASLTNEQRIRAIYEHYRETCPIDRQPSFGMVEQAIRYELSLYPDTPTQNSNTTTENIEEPVANWPSQETPF